MNDRINDENKTAEADNESSADKAQRSYTDAAELRASSDSSISSAEGNNAYASRVHLDNAVTESTAEQAANSPGESADDGKTISFTPIKKTRLDTDKYIEDHDVGDSPHKPGAEKKRSKGRRPAPRASTVIFWCIAAVAVAATAIMYFRYNAALKELSRAQAEYEQAETQMKERSERNKTIEDKLAKLNEQIEALDSQLQ